MDLEPEHGIKDDPFRGSHSYRTATDVTNEKFGWVLFGCSYLLVEYSIVSLIYMTILS